MSSLRMPLNRNLASAILPEAYLSNMQLLPPVIFIEYSIIIDYVSVYNCLNHP